MAIISIEEFNAYTGNYEDADTLKRTILDSAESIVKSHLGYDPTVSERCDILSAIGQNRLYLKARPITEIERIHINGTEYAPNDFYLCDDYIIRKDLEEFPSGVDNVVIMYRTGYGEEGIPAQIKTAVLQISSLMLAETNGNIGVTGKAMGEISRTFVSYTNYDKWLKNLDNLKVIKL